MVGVVGTSLPTAIQFMLVTMADSSPTAAGSVALGIYRATGAQHPIGRRVVGTSCRDMRSGLVLVLAGCMFA